MYALGYCDGHQAIMLGKCAIKYEQVGTEVKAIPFCE